MSTHIVDRIEAIRFPAEVTGHYRDRYLVCELGGDNNVKPTAKQVTELYRAARQLLLNTERTPALAASLDRVRAALEPFETSQRGKRDVGIAFYGKRPADELRYRLKHVGNPHEESTPILRRRGMPYSATVVGQA